METRMAADFHDRTEEDQKLHDERNAQQRAVWMAAVEKARAEMAGDLAPSPYMQAHLRQQAQITDEYKGVLDMLKATEAELELKAYLDAWDAPYPTVEEQTQKHLAALEAALVEAVQNVKRDPRFQYIKTSQGRHALTGPGNFYDEHHMQEYMEAVQAFLYGDIALALQKRDQFIGTFAVAP